MNIQHVKRFSNSISSKQLFSIFLLEINWNRIPSLFLNWNRIK